MITLRNTTGRTLVFHLQGVRVNLPSGGMQFVSGSVEDFAEIEFVKAGWLEVEDLEPKPKKRKAKSKARKKVSKDADNNAGDSQ